MNIKLIFFLVSILFSLTAASKVVVTNSGDKIEHIIFFKKYKSLIKDIQKERRQYEPLQLFLSKKNDSEKKLAKFIANPYKVKLDINQVSYNWEVGVLIISTSSVVDLIMPKNTNATTQHSITIPIDISKGRELSAMPEAIELTSTVSLTKYGYGIVLSYALTQYGKTIYKQKG